MDPRWIVIVLANALLVFLGGQLNHYLAHWSVSVFLLGAAIPLAGLRLRFQPGLIAMFLSGLLIDAARPPVFFGSSALLYATLFTCWHAIRLRLKRDGLAPQIIGALLANIVLYFAQPLLLGIDVAKGTTLSRLVVDLSLSELAVALVIPWFFALQEHALLLRGVDLANEARQPGGAL